MKLVAGVTGLRQARCLLPLGAEELYCALSSINSHRNPSEGIGDVRELKALANLCRSLKTPLYLAVNETYPERDYAAILKKAVQFARAGGTGLIIRDLGLAGFLRKNGFDRPLVLSTLGWCFNTEALKFYARQGLSRITLPQLLPAREGRRIIERSGKLETEVFYSPADRCVNLNGACRLHDAPLLAPRGYKPHANCTREFHAGPEPFRFPSVPEAERLDSLEQFYRMGVGFLKVPRLPDLDRSKATVAAAAGFLKRMRAGGAR